MPRLIDWIILLKNGLHEKQYEAQLMGLKMREFISDKIRKTSRTPYLKS